MKMEVQFPVNLDCEKMAIRALYVKYDHLSDLSDTFDKPPIPEEYDIGIKNIKLKKIYQILVCRFAKSNEN